MINAKKEIKVDYVIKSYVKLGASYLSIQETRKVSFRKLHVL